MEPGILNLLVQGNGFLIAGLILLGVGMLMLVMTINAFATSRFKKSHMLMARRNHMSLGSLLTRLLSSFLIIFFALSVFLTGAALRSYTIFTKQDLIGRLECLQSNAEQKTMLVKLTPISLGQEQHAQTYALPGDQWEVNARILKWTPRVNLLGLHTAYRLNMIKGIYQNPEDEAKRAHQAYALNSGQDWLWTLLTQYQKYLPFVQAVYGNAVSNPIQPGEVYEIYVTTSGLSVEKR